MYERTPEFAARSQPTDRPLVLVGLTTSSGLRVYADFSPSPAMVGFGQRCLADGSHLADGSAEAGAGSESVLARHKALVSLGDLNESLVPRPGELMGTLSQIRETGLKVVLENRVDADGRSHFSKILASEGLIGGRAELALTYPGLSSDAALVRFNGRVVSYRLGKGRLTLNLKAL